MNAIQVILFVLLSVTVGGMLFYGISDFVDKKVKERSQRQRIDLWI